MEKAIKRCESQIKKIVTVVERTASLALLDQLEMREKELRHLKSQLQRLPLPTKMPVAENLAERWSKVLKTIQEYALHGDTVQAAELLKKIVRKATINPILGSKYDLELSISMVVDVVPR